MKTIIQKNLKYMVLLPLILWQTNVLAQQNIHGKVIDGKTSQALPGVNIVVKGTTNGTATDPNGNYSLSVSASNDTLIYSYIGYQSQTVPIMGRSEINVKLMSRALQGKQLVVIGYGTQQKRDLTGSISTVNSKQFKKNVTPSIGDALQGRVAGVSVQNSGTPGAAPYVKIRGPATFGNNQPLYVVDGVPVGGIQDFDLSDVKSIQVLKDASAAAIYGSRAANGVIIITTKQGQKGKVKVNYNGYYGSQSIVKRYDMLNSTQYQKFDDLILQNAGWSIPPANDPNSSNYVDPNKVNTNWQNAAFVPATIQKHDITISGGTKNSTYALSGSYFDQGGTLKGPGPSFNRYTGRINVDNTFGKFEVKSSAYYANWKKINLTGLHGASPIFDILHAIPIQPIYDPNNVGGYSGTDGQIEPTISLNVIGANNLLQSNTNVDRFLGSITAKYNFMSNLYYKMQYSYDNSFVKGFQFIPDYNLGFFYNNSNAKLDVNEDRYNTQIVQNTLHYKKDIGDNHIGLMVGYTQTVSNHNNLHGHAEGYTQPYFEVLNAGTQNKNTSGYQQKNTLRSFLGRLTYNYKDTYLVNGTLRRDGSSRFSPKHKYGIFPSISLGWRISNESFFNSISFLKKNVNDLKLRASYGKLGNQDIGDYAYTAFINNYAHYEFNGNMAQGDIQVSLANPNIQWETNISRDIGLDIGLLNDKVTLNIDYYNNLAENILVQVPIPPSTGSVSAPTINAASLLNKGLEFSADYKGSKGAFHYDVSGNLSTLHNKVLSLGQGNSAIYGNGTKTVVGGSIGEFYGYVTNGIFQNWDQVYNYATQNQAPNGGRNSVTAQTHTAPGDFKFKDLNGDGKITADGDRTFLGSPIPKFKYGFNANLSYKNWDMSIFFQGVYGNKILNRMRQLVQDEAGYGNYDTYVYNNHWTSQNHSNTVPRPVYGDPNNNGRNSNRWLEDGSYLQLKNLQIGYTIPHKISNKVGINNLRIYVQGQNVFTITKYSGYSPIISHVLTGVSRGGPSGTADGLFSRGVDVGSYPQPRTLSLGLTLGF
ncbi:MAG TPA: TonB-dependent receptor [Balneolales bacterium]|nr:TonB-dependent receptor [Balneolales bacterium]